VVSRRTRSAKVKKGDIFEIPSPDGRHGYGQVIVGGTAFYVAILAELYQGQPDLDEMLKGAVLLVGWTLDALIYHGRWKIVGNRPPISARVPFPSYKVRVKGMPHVHDFNGENYRPATAHDWELLDNKTIVSAIRYQNALLAHHDLERYRLECVAVPANELGERGRTVLDAGERGRILQDDLAVFRPGDCRYAVRERPGFLMDDCLAATKPHNRGVASRAVRLLPDLDVSHGDPRGDMGFLSPLRLPGNR